MKRCEETHVLHDSSFLQHKTISIFCPNAVYFWLQVLCHLTSQQQFSSVFSYLHRPLGSFLVAMSLYQGNAPFKAQSHF